MLQTSGHSIDSWVIILHLTSVCHLDDKIISPFQMPEYAGACYLDMLRVLRTYRVVFTTYSDSLRWWMHLFTPNLTKSERWLLMLDAGNTKLTQTHNFFPRRFCDIFTETKTHPTDHGMSPWMWLNVKERKFYGSQK